MFLTLHNQAVQGLSCVTVGVTASKKHQRYREASDRSRAIHVLFASANWLIYVPVVCAGSNLITSADLGEVASANCVFLTVLGAL